MLSASEDGTVSVYDTRVASEDDALVTVLCESHGSALKSVGTFGPDRGGVWGVSGMSTLSLWSLASAEEFARFDSLAGLCRDPGDEDDSGELIDCYYHEASGSLLCAGASQTGGDLTVMTVQPSGVSSLRRLTGGHSDSVRCASWVDGGASLVACVTGGEDGRLCVWGAPPASDDRGGADEVRIVAPTDVVGLAGGKASSGRPRKPKPLIGQKGAENPRPKPKSR